MAKFFLGLLLLVAFASGAVVGPSQSSLAILLDVSGLCKNAPVDSWEKLQLDRFLKERAFYGDPSSIYCHSYDASMSPSEAVDSLFKGNHSVFGRAIEKWKQRGERSKSEYTPNKFIIIADGAAGLAVREYLQGKDYQGEIENVVFFNTPHEGSGFADQALLNAIGIPLLTLYKGTWDAGEHAVTLDMKSVQPASYIVLRKGSEILSWKLLN